MSPDPRIKLVAARSSINSHHCQHLGTKRSLSLPEVSDSSVYVCLGMCVCVTHLFSPGLWGNWSLSGLIGFFKEWQLIVHLLRAPCENRLPVLRHRQTPRVVRKKFQRHLQLFSTVLCSGGDLGGSALRQAFIQR